MSKKIAKLLKGLQEVQGVIHELDAAGVDIDRIVGISNAQGPGGKLLKGLFDAVLGTGGHSTSASADEPTKTRRALKSASKSK